MIDDKHTMVFARLFRGRTDVYGTEEGSCERVGHEEAHRYPERILQHLEGVQPMGVYPMVYHPIEGTWTVNWGCVDFDEGDDASFIHALNLKTVLEAFGIIGFIERSRSKGYHVWVFASQEIPAKLMREALLAGCQMVQAPTKEINPKQAVMEPNQVGNYVRLPYVHEWVTTHRRCMVDEDGWPISLETFTEIAYPQRVTIEELEPLAAMFEQPKAVSFTQNAATSNGTDLPDTRFMNATAFMTWRDGPFDGKDRSSTLWKLASELQLSGYGADETLLLVCDADIRWGKHMARNDLAGLQKMVDKIYLRTLIQ